MLKIFKLLYFKPSKNLLDVIFIKFHGFSRVSAHHYCKVLYKPASCISPLLPPPLEYKAAQSFTKIPISPGAYTGNFTVYMCQLMPFG